MRRSSSLAVAGLLAVGCVLPDLDTSRVESDGAGGSGATGATGATGGDGSHAAGTAAATGGESAGGSSVGLGGVVGSGGAVGLGGAVGSGGFRQSGGSGGLGTGGGGGAGASGGSASGGTPGTGGIEDPLACTSDKQCQALELVCDVERGRCVECVTNENCAQNWLCVDGDCVFDDSCTTQEECVGAPDEQSACDEKWGLCVQCVDAGDCAKNHDCIEYRCVPYAPCTGSSDCAENEQVCNTEAGRCVDCLSNDDCGEGLPVCGDSVCHAGCSSTDQCPDALRCLRSVGYCVECRGSEECDPSSHCVDGVCRPDVCSAEQSHCQAAGVAPCNEEGDGFGPVEPCEIGEACVAVAGIAECQLVGQAGGGGKGEGGAGAIGGQGGTQWVGGAESVGGEGGAAGIGGEGGTQSAGGAQSTGGSAGTCAGKGDPCAAIPRFEGHQVVDADGSEFCGVPFFELDFGNNNSAVTDWRKEGPYPEHALARIAWSEDALHVFIEVTDPTVHAWGGSDLWEGDAVEVMARVRSAPTGNLNDEDAVHAIATWNAAVMRDASGTYQPMHVALYEGKLVETGYVVELRVPWPDSVGTLKSGDLVWFDMTLDATNAEDGETWRDAQAMFYLGSASEGCAEPGCNDLLWCRSRLE